MFPRVREGLISEWIDEDLFVYDPDSDQLVVLNATAAIIFEFCDGTHSVESIAAEISKAFGVERARWPTPRQPSIS